MTPKTQGSRREVENSIATAHARRTRPIEQGVISLVNADGNIFFVRWTDPARRLARQISLDGKFRVITIVAATVPVLDLSGCDIIIPDTGAVMIVTTAAGRPAMPFWCITVRVLEQTRLFCGPLGDLDADECPICEFGESVGFHLGGDTDMYRCSKCLIVFHVSCARRFAPLVDTEHFKCFLCLGFALP